MNNLLALIPIQPFLDAPRNVVVAAAAGVVVVDHLCSCFHSLVQFHQA